MKIPKESTIKLHRAAVIDGQRRPAGWSGQVIGEHILPDDYVSLGKARPQSHQSDSKTNHKTNHSKKGGQS